MDKNSLDALLRTLTDTVSKHETKLALDGQAISRLDKDTDKVAQSVDKLAITVADMAGTVKTQSNTMNAILGVTLIAFLGMTVKSVIESKSKPSIETVAKEFVVTLQKEMDAQKDVQAQIRKAHKLATQKP